MTPIVAIQGYSGCFHEEAARRFYSGLTGQFPQIVECPTFESLYTAMSEGRATSAVMAIENTISGGLLLNFDLLRKHGKKIKGEVYLPIHQNLMAIHQTRRFFRKQCPWINLVESEDTAKSAIDIARDRLMGVGAVASKLAAEQNGLEILAEGIETYKDNFTRFLVLDDYLEIPEKDINKSTLCFTLPHTPGSLSHILAILSFYELNLSRIQSLPIPGQRWQYFFYADLRFETYERYCQAISAIRPLLVDLDVLGEYQSAL